MEELEQRLPGCRISHDEADFVIVNWQHTLGGVRQRSGDGKWIVAVHDILESELETAPAVERLASSRGEALRMLCDMALQLVKKRESQHPSG
jgi:hypothetical protein